MTFEVLCLENAVNQVKVLRSRHSETLKTEKMVLNLSFKSIITLRKAQELHRPKTSLIKRLPLANFYSIQFEESGELSVSRRRQIRFSVTSLHPACSSRVRSRTKARLHPLHPPLHQCV
ncbi:hypothetical protein G7K_2235-t1 [Saitoella complicata NRRL Y-17804]|uniref:Uncharacterized protein n=1 Tax=Saitoella complicata (strain BCRC 22490 / CBS 7301 / JCM 7358 / NBRC 10748 / NRRL Y-17804) TaxID=698492 RepID=A0A0E9NDW5_SAICN|nr:hypothetical protein G7K_2235-t1 [Saitoella complicata NRRL Y-17804]